MLYIAAPPPPDPAAFWEERKIKYGECFDSMFSCYFVVFHPMDVWFVLAIWGVRGKIWCLLLIILHQD